MNNSNSVLFAFPCAGGSSSNYRKWYGKISCCFKAFEYKGHWTRYEEGQYLSIDELIKDGMEIITKETEPSNVISLFGHSMGGLVAYLLADQLEKLNYNVGRLFLSSCVPPKNTDAGLFMADDNEIKQFLYTIRQVSYKTLNSSFFTENLLPPLKNDFRLLAEIKGKAVDKIDIPITCFYGNCDTVIEDKNLFNRWQEYTTKKVEFCELNGDHFYLNLNQNLIAMCNYINEKIN